MGRNRALGSPYQTERVSADFTTDYRVDAYLIESVPVAVTLDPHAANHDQVEIQDLTLQAATRPIVIYASEGQTISGFGTTFALSVNGGSVQLTFSEGAWIPVAQGVGSGANPSWLEPAWYIDWLNGDDGNTGTSAALAVKTYTGGIRPRWGTDSPTLQQDTTFYILTPQPTGAEHAGPAPVLVKASNFVIIGTLAPVGAPFVAGAVTPKTIGSPGNLLTMAGVPAGTQAGQHIQRMSDGSLAVIDSISGGVAVITQPYDLSIYTTVTAVPSPTFADKVDSWATGQVFQILQAPSFNLTQALVAGGDSNASFTAPTEWVQFVRIPDASGTVGTSQFTAKTFGPGMCFSGCIFEPTPVLDGSIGSFQINAIGCWAPGGALLIGQGVFWYGGASNTNGTYQTAIRASLVDGSCILHGLVEFEEIYSNIGEAYVDSGAGVIHGASVQMYPGTADPAHPGGIIWGPGRIYLEGPNAGFVRSGSPGATFANSIDLSSIIIDLSSTATKYVPGAPGVFTDGVPINVANLDAFGGLQNPITGSRIA